VRADLIPPWYKPPSKLRQAAYMVILALGLLAWVQVAAEVKHDRLDLVARLQCGWEGGPEEIVVLRIPFTGAVGKFEYRSWSEFIDLARLGCP
jgi:hypothetical protein